MHTSYNLTDDRFLTVLTPIPMADLFQECYPTSADKISILFNNIRGLLFPVHLLSLYTESHQSIKLFFYGYASDDTIYSPVTLVRSHFFVTKYYTIRKIQLEHGYRSIADSYFSLIDY